MRKNRTKHEAKKPRLAKRALALCFALIFVCSCLLPAFAHSEGNLLADTAADTAVVEQQDEQQPEEPVLLNESDEQPKTEGTTEEQPKPEEPAASSSASSEEPAASSSASSEESASSSESESAASSGASSEEPASSASSGEAASASSSASSTVTSGDVINQGEAVYTYRFWTEEIDAFHLEQVDLAVKNGDSLTAAAKSVTGIAPCEVLKVANHAHLADYTVTEPTKDGYEFAGWYTLENGTAYEFSFDQNVSFEESKTIDVFAKWVSVAEKNAEKYRGWYENLVNTSDRYTLEELAEEYSKDDGFKEYINALSDDDFATLMEKFDAEIDEDAVYEMDEDEGEYGIAMASIMPDVPASQKIVTVGNSVTLRTSYYDYYDRGTHRWTSSNTSVATVTGNKNYLGYPTNTAVVKGVSEGTVTITHTYTSSSGTTQTDKITLRVVSSKEDKNGAYYLYCYTLIPGKVADTSEAADKVWNGMGVGSVTGLGAPSKDNHITGQRLDDGYGSSGALITYPDDYPDITYCGKTYHYSKTAEQRYQEGYYTITWFRILQAGGANTGNNGYNPVVDDKILTYHLDGQINLNEKDIVTLDFKLEDAGEDNYELVDPETYSRRVSVGTNLGTLNPTLKVPSEAATKVVGGFTYDFDGWYDNENCVGSKVNFSSYRVEKKTTFYGRYVPRDTMQEDKPFITVEKNVVGIEEGQLGNNFFVKVGNKYLQADRGAEVVKKSPDGKSWTLRWTIQNATEGTYDVSEENTEVPNYTLTNVEGVGRSVTTKNAQTTVREVKYETSCSTTVFDVTKTSTEDFVFAAALTTGGVKKTVIISRDPLSANVRKKIESFIQTYSGNWKPNYVYYSVYKDGSYVSEFVIDGKKITYDGTQIHLDKTKDWTHVATLTYDISGGINPEISITNTYKPNTLDIKITKKVDSGDKTKDFKFKVTSDNFSTTDNVSLTNRDGTSQKPQEWFYLKDGESATLHGLKKDYIFTIEEEKENSAEYDTTATENIKVEAGNTKSFRYKVVEENGQLVLQPIAEKGNSQLLGKLNITDGKVVVTNRAAATSLTVTKNVVEGNAKVPDNAEFTFRLTVKNDVKVYQKVKLTKNGEDITEKSVVSGHKNQWEFTLKNGGSVHISGIRIDDEKVKVEEVINDNHYTTKYKVDNGVEVDGKEAAIPTATLSANQNSGTTVEFTNTYNIPKLEAMTIQKKVTGEFGERSKMFTFSVTLDNAANPALLSGVTHPNVANLTSFTMKHGEHVELKNIPVGTTITITETDADEYKTSATGHGKPISSGDRTFTYEVVEKDGKAVLVSVGEESKPFDGSAITVTNSFDGNPDTGVLLDTLPYLILLAVAVAGGVLVVVRKRKHRDE